MVFAYITDPESTTFHTILTNEREKEHFTKFETTGAVIHGELLTKKRIFRCRLLPRFRQPNILFCLLRKLIGR